MAVDLHTHSSASDGTVHPAKLPELAAEAGLKAIALTDHDTVDGLPDFLSRSQDFPELELIKGVELSSSHGARELHIVGLFIDEQSPELQSFIAQMQEERKLRSLAMQQKLKDLGYIVTPSDLQEIGAPEDVPGRPHFAQVLVKKYNFPDVKTVFERLLKRGGAGYVPRNLPPPEAAIKAIKDANGVAVWAHLLCSNRNENNFIRRMLRELKIAGLDAIEGYYTEYTPHKTALAEVFAKEYSLALSGGSDFHGDVHPEVALGTGHGNLQVPDSVLDSLKRAREPKLLIL